MRKNTIATTVAYLGFGKGRGHGERKPITGVWGPSPQRGAGAEPLVGGSGRQSPLKLKHFLLLNVQWKPQIRPFFSEIRKRRKSLRRIRCNLTWRF